LPRLYARISIGGGGRRQPPVTLLTSNADTFSYLANGFFSSRSIDKEKSRMTPNRSFDNLRRYFAGLTEYTFQTQLGFADISLVDYVSDLLTRFVRTDTLYAVRSPVGKRLGTVADMMAEAQARVGEARRQAHRHIGDYTLFWTGVYPEALERLQSPHEKDHLLEFRAQGKRAYFVASTIPAESLAPGPDVLERLSTQFELCAYGLREVRREWERRDDGLIPGVWIND
jgi:hypothetical protein